MSTIYFEDLSKSLAKQLVEELDGSTLCDFLNHHLQIDAEYEGVGEWIIDGHSYFESEMQDFIVSEIAPLEGEELEELYNDFSDEKKVKYLEDSMFEFK